MKLKEIHSVTETLEDGVFNVHCTIEDMDGQVYAADFCSRPDDPHGVNGEVRQWLDDHPDFPRDPYEPPEEPEPIIIVYPVDLWSRMTDDEADQVEGVMASQSVRIQNIFKSASSYRSDHELWPLLVSVATTLFGEQRADEILAPSGGLNG